MLCNVSTSDAHKMSYKIQLILKICNTVMYHMINMWFLIFYICIHTYTCVSIYMYIYICKITEDIIISTLLYKLYKFKFHKFKNYNILKLTMWLMGRDFLFRVMKKLWKKLWKSCTILWMQLMPLNSTLKMVKWQTFVIYIVPNLKKT